MQLASTWAQLVHMNAASEHMNAASEHMNAASEHMTAASEHMNAASGHINAEPVYTRVHLTNINVQKVFSVSPLHLQVFLAQAPSPLLLPFSILAPPQFRLERLPDSTQKNYSHQYCNNTYSNKAMR